MAALRLCEILLNDVLQLSEWRPTAEVDLHLGNMRAENGMAKDKRYITDMSMKKLTHLMSRITAYLPKFVSSKA